MEVFTENKKNINYKGIFNILVEIFFAGKVNRINIWSNLYTEEHIQLEKLGFRETYFNTYFGIIPFKNYKEIFDVRNWHYRFIDSDLF